MTRTDGRTERVKQRNKQKQTDRLFTKAHTSTNDLYENEV